MAMALPASQCRDDADQRCVTREIELASCCGSAARRKLRRVDAGRHRIDAARVDAIVANELFAQRVAGGHDSRRGAPIQPLRCRIVGHGDRYVACPYENRTLALPQAEPTA